MSAVPGRSQASSHRSPQGEDTPVITASLFTRPLESVRVEGFGRRLQQQSFLFLTGGTLGSILSVTPEDVATFANCWSNLTLDRHMGDGGTYRYRRYGEFETRPGTPRRQLPHGPYEQPKYINNLNGGVSRLFDPLEHSFVSNLLLNRLLDWLTHLYDQCEGAPQRWNIRLHPYRVVANSTEAGNPTPEGLHRDGVDYIVSLLVMRNNVVGGESSITDNQGQVLWERTLQEPLDIVIGQDLQTMHAVTPVTPANPRMAAWRDVLVVAFTRVTP
jgi:hypothetical protein